MSWFQTLVDPMDKKYCNVFYGLSIYYIISMVLLIFASIFLLGDIKRNKMRIFYSLIAIITLFVMYVSNRLLYNMCK